VEISIVLDPQKVLMMLQWGHVFSDVEISFFSSSGFAIYPGFNGATSFQTWKFLSSPPRVSQSTRASMGPRLFRRGNEGGDLDAASALELQWGHVFSDVEILLEYIPVVVSSAASMGPRLFRRGNVSCFLRDFRYFVLQWGHVFSDVEITFP